MSFKVFKGGCFLRGHAISLQTCHNVPSAVRLMSSHMFGHHLATVRLAGRKRHRHARFESSVEALAEQWRAQPWSSCMGAAPGCRLQRRSSVNILTAWPWWPGRAAQAPRAGRARAPWSCTPCWHLSRDPHSSGTSYSSTARRRSELGNRRPLYIQRAAQLASCSGPRFANSDTPVILRYMNRVYLVGIYFR